jgi:hypothetical protein
MAAGRRRWREKRGRRRGRETHGVLHVGHSEWLSLMYSHMHSSQKLCMHGPLRGFVKTSRQIGHLHSWTRAKRAFSRCLASSSIRAAPRRPAIRFESCCP